ncbi:MAG: alpha/beta fold hydrolase [Planctomycetota bacterium]|nr:alpha/beta fold hydrolase [Planctomycetota bacterium]
MLRRAPIPERSAALAALLALLTGGCLSSSSAEGEPLQQASRVDSSVGREDAAERAPRSEVVVVSQSVPAAAQETVEDVSEVELAIAPDPEELDADARQAGPSPDPAGAGVELAAGAGESVVAEAESETERPGEAGEPTAEETGDLRAAEAEAPGDQTASDEGDAPAVEEVVEVAAAPESSGPGPEPAIVQTGDGLEMSYTVRAPLTRGRGEELAVVFVQGWCGDGGQWDGAAAALPGARIVVVDLVGHGASRDQARTDWTVPRFGDDVARVLDAEDLGRVVLVGHGMGGQVCLEVALRAPERVAAIVGVDCLQRLAGDPNPGRLQQYAETFRRDYEAQTRQFVGAALGDGASPELADRIVGEILAAPREMALALMEHFGVHDPRRAAPRIECGVVCINSATLATDVQGNRALLSSFDVEVLDGVGHWIHLEAPGRFAETLRGVLRDTAPAPAAPRLLQSLSPALVVEDPVSIADFYTERLSFRIARRTPQDLAEPAALIVLERDGARIVVQSLASLRADVTGTPVAPRAGVLFLGVESLDAELEALGDDVPLVGPERELRSGARQAVIADPAGNLVVIREIDAAPSDG